MHRKIFSPLTPSRFPVSVLVLLLSSHCSPSFPGDANLFPPNHYPGNLSPPSLRTSESLSKFALADFHRPLHLVPVSSPGAQYASVLLYFAQVIFFFPSRNIFRALFPCLRFHLQNPDFCWFWKIFPHFVRPFPHPLTTLGPNSFPNSNGVFLRFPVLLPLQALHTSMRLTFPLSHQDIRKGSLFYYSR